MSKSQKFQLYDQPAQMEPLLPADHRMGPLLERSHDLIRKADRLSGWCPSGALPGLRSSLRAMNSYYSNKIEGQHTLPLEIEQALRNDYAQDADKARRLERIRAAKAALNQLIHTAAIEVARSHPQAVVACLHPGTVATGFTEKYVGSRPTVTPDVAAGNLLAVVDGLTPAETGGFFDWQGKAVAW